MIFLGAGASKAFELKTLQDLTNILVTKMKELGHEKTILDIIEAMKKFDLTPDFENIYTTLEALSNPQEGIKKSGGLAAYIAHKTNYELQKEPKVVTQYKEILSDFRELIYRECSVSKGIIEKKGMIFDHLFNAYNGYESRYLSTLMGGNGDYKTVGIDSTIVTTNYDVVMELYHRSKEKWLANGFRQSRGLYTSELDFSEYARYDTAHWLIKLHGSIWQFKLDNGKIIQTIAQPDSLPLKISIGEKMMIYPIGEKPILQQPYFSFYNAFREQPWETLVVIGYSFRDEPVNTAIIDRLTQRPPPKKKLIVVDPDAENVVKNLGLLPEAIDQRIIRINQPFEDNAGLFERISLAVESKDWNQFQESLERTNKI